VLEALADLAIRLVGWLFRNRQVELQPGARINLGSGPHHIAPGWLNIDASAHVLLSPLPAPLLRLILKRTEAGTASADVLKAERFLFHDFRHGIPVGDDVASAIYSSHMLEHLDDEVARRLLAEAYRVLLPGGVLRVVVPEVPEGALDVHEETDRYLDRHRSRYTPAHLRRVIEEAGFGLVLFKAFKEGDCPDADVLDNRPASIFVEGVK
jgi:predicted SAM-dependent methyltransferase